MNHVYCPGCGKVATARPSDEDNYFYCKPCHDTWEAHWRAQSAAKEGVLTEVDFLPFDGYWDEEAETRRARYLFDRLVLAKLDICEDEVGAVDTANALASAAFDLDDYRAGKEPLPCPIVRPATWQR